MTTRQEMETIVELALTKMDLNVTKEVGAVREELKTIPPLIDKKIRDYDDRQIRRRQWMARTVITATGLALTAIGLFLTRCAG